MSDSVVYRIVIDPDGAISGTREVRDSVDDIGDGLDDVTQKTDGFGAKAVAIGTIAAQAFTRISGRIRQTITESIELGQRQEQAEQRVRALVESTGMAAGFTAEQLFNMASQMQSITTFGDEQILESQAKLLTFRRVSEDAFERTMRAAMDLSAAGFGSLESTVNLLGRALNDPIQGLQSLTRVGKTFTDEQKEQIATLMESNDLYGAQKVILQEIEGQVQGTAEALAQTDTGAIQQMNNQIGDLQENIGLLIMRGTGPLVREITETVNQLNRWLGTPISRELQEEQIRVNALVSSIMDHNTTADRRNDLIKELRKIQPDLVEGLDSESVSAEQLRDRLREVNDQYVERIILQGQSEEVENNARRIGQALNQQARVEIALREQLIKSAQDQGLAIENFVTKPIEEQIRIAKEAIFVDEETYRSSSRRQTAYARLTGFVARYNRSVRVVQEAEIDAAEQAEKHRQIREMLGLTFDNTAKKAEASAGRVKETYDQNLDDFEAFTEQHGMTHEQFVAMIERQANESSNRISEVEGNVHDQSMENIEERRRRKIEAANDEIAQAQRVEEAVLRSEQIKTMAILRSIEQQIMYANSVGEAIHSIIEAALAETVAHAIRSSFATSGNPILGFAMAGIGAALARRAFRTMVPRFADGGWPDGPGGERDDRIHVRVSKGEHITNAASARNMVSVLNFGNASPENAAMVNRIFHNNTSHSERVIHHHSSGGSDPVVVHFSGEVRGDRISLVKDRADKSRSRATLEVF